MSNELPNGDTRKEGDIDTDNPADRKEQFEVISSNLERFMAEQDDPKWRLSVLGELEHEARIRKPEWLNLQEMQGYYDALENHDINGYIAGQIQRIQKYFEEYGHYFGGKFPPTIKFLTDSLPNIQDHVALESAAFILGSFHGDPVGSDGVFASLETRMRRSKFHKPLYGTTLIDPEKFEFGSPAIDNPSVYAFSHSEAALKEASEFYKSMTHGRRSERGIATRWPEDWWKSDKVWWNLKPNNLDELGRLLQNQTVVMDLSDPNFEWEGHRKMLEFCKSMGISNILTEKSPDVIYAHHFIRDVSR
ncbi:MAG: hypothetical protein AAB374_02075 [Patescibacteria group bacterium]